MALTLRRLSDCRFFDAEFHPGQGSSLWVFEPRKNLPFALERVFYVHADTAIHRGYHAHRYCSQVLICLAGVCDVTLDDGTERITHTLAVPSRGLFMPAGIWGEQAFRSAGTLVLTLCDQPFDQADYIRDYDAFLRFRAEHAAASPKRT